MLPNIIKSVDNVHRQMETNDEYKDWTTVEDLKAVNSQVSLRSWNIVNRSDSKPVKSKSLWTRKNSKGNKQGSSIKTINNDNSLNNWQYVEQVYKQKKWSFVKLNKNNKNELGNYEIPKSQTRKSTLPYLSPDHHEVIRRYINDGRAIINSNSKSKEKSSLIGTKQPRIPIKANIIAQKNMRSNMIPGGSSMLMINGKTASQKHSDNFYNVYL